MSKPNLPPPSFYQKHEDVCGTEVGPPTPFWNQAAVEEAVRQALAAQAPVAWLYHDGKPGSVPFPDDLSASMAVSLIRRPEWRNETPLAIIPETRDG